jgi:hypothetical protein
MAQLPITILNRTGILSNTAGAAVAAAGDTFPNDGNTFIEVNNGGGTTITVTIQPTQTVDGQAAAPKVISIVTLIRAMIGPFATAQYNDGNGNVGFLCSAIATVTAKAIRPTL